MGPCVFFLLLGNTPTRCDPPKNNPPKKKGTHFVILWEIRWEKGEKKRLTKRATWYEEGEEDRSNTQPPPLYPLPSLSFPLPNTPDNIAETNAAVFGQSVLLAYHSFNSNLMKFLQFGWKMSKSIVYFFMKVLERDNSLTYQSYPTTNFLPFLSLLLVFFSLIVCTANLASSTPTNMSVQ